MDIYNTHINKFGVRWAHVIGQSNEIYFGWCANGKSEFKKLTTQIQTKNTTNVNHYQKKETQRKIKCEIWLTLIGYSQNIKRMARKTIARRSVAFSTRNAITWTFSFTKSNQKYHRVVYVFFFSVSFCLNFNFSTVSCGVWFLFRALLRAHVYAGNGKKKIDEITRCVCVSVWLRFHRVSVRSWSQVVIGQKPKYKLSWSYVLVAFSRKKKSLSFVNRTVKLCWIISNHYTPLKRP